MRHRHALTLLEVIISLAIFGVFMAMAMQTFVGMGNMTQVSDDGTAIDEDVLRLTRFVSNDLCNTGWFYWGVEQGYGSSYPLYPQVHFSRTTTPQSAYGRSLTSPRPRIETVSVTNGAETASQVSAFCSKQDGSVVAPGVANHYSGDVLYFVRLRGGTAVASNPAALASDSVSFLLSASKPIPLSQPEAAPATYALVFQYNSFGGSDPNIVQVWESSQGGLTWSQNCSPSYLRIYRYYLKSDPSTNGRTAILMRSYINSQGGSLSDDNTTWPWVDDREICRDVESLVIDTYKTDQALRVNQVRFRVGFLRYHPSGQLRRTFEGAFSMRSLTDPS